MTIKIIVVVLGAAVCVNKMHAIEYNAFFYPFVD